MFCARTWRWSSFHHSMFWKLLEILNRWYNECGLGEHGLSERSLLLSYFLAAASTFEPERSKERLAWAKTTALINTIKAYLSSERMLGDHDGAVLHEFQHYCSNLDYVSGVRYSSNLFLFFAFLVFSFGKENQLLQPLEFKLCACQVASSITVD